MDDNEIIERPDSWDEQPKKRQVSPYEMLIRQSRKMGATATKTYDVTRQFLKQDVNTLYPQQILPTKKPSTNSQKTTKKLNRIVKQSHEMLAFAQTVILPNNLFPDTVVVDRNKITINKKTFFWSSNVISLRIEDILNVTCSIGPLFGSLTVSTRVMNSTDHYEVNYLWRADATNLKQIIQGYMIAVHNDLDLSHLTKEEITEKLHELGHEPGT